MPKSPDDKNGDLDTRTKPKGELSTLEKPKVLLTGKPLYVDGRHEPCEIEWAEGSVGGR